MKKLNFRTAKWIALLIGVIVIFVACKKDCLCDPNYKKTTLNAITINSHQINFPFSSTKPKLFLKASK